MDIFKHRNCFLCDVIGKPKDSVDSHFIKRIYEVVKNNSGSLSYK